MPIYINDKKLDDVSVARIEFTSVPQPSECEAAIKVLGSIKDLNLGDVVKIGPTPVNNLGVMGKIVGRDDMDNILLVDTTTIRSIPKQTVGEIASRDVISFSKECSIKEAAINLSKNNIDGAPVVENGNIIGLFTLTELVKAIADDKQDLTVGELMSTEVCIVNEDLKILHAIEVMLKKSISRLIITDKNNKLMGIVTRTDLINIISNFDQFPIITE